MTKLQLVKQVAKATGFSRKETSILVESVFDEIKSILLEHGKLDIRGFGSFRVRKAKPRRARNPKKNEEVRIGERYLPHLKFSKIFRDEIIATNLDF